MFSRRTIAALTAIAALAGGTACSATASADPPAPGDTPVGSLIQKKPVTLIQKKPAKTIRLRQPRTRCRAWRVQGQTWWAGQDNGYTLMFTLRSSSTSSRFSGKAQYYVGDYENLVGSQYLSGSVGTDPTGVIHMDIVWSNGSSGQYNATAYDVRPTKSGGLTASLQGTTVDTSGGGGATHWVADGLEAPLGDGSFIRPLYCRPGDAVR